MAEWTDGSVYPGTDVLVNKRGIRDPATLAKVEHRVVQQAIQELKLTDKELLTPAAIARTHGQLFGALYDWAGQHRTVNISKGGTHFLPADRIGTGLAYVSEGLQRAVPPSILEDLKGEARRDPFSASAQFAVRIAGPVAELNYVHPFREGNGRALRAYVDQIAARAGLRLDSTRIERLPWILASKASSADPTQTRGIEHQLREALVPREKQRGRQADRPRDQGRARGRDDSLER